MTDFLYLFYSEIMSREITCPLMEEKTADGEYRFEEKIRFCDCPKLRVLFLLEGIQKECNDGKECFARVAFLR
ncbi:MAG: hypothetical protein WC835_00745 [Candidatus Paceibacterota bacterium]|jgi:hypothetical protein